MPVLDQGLSAHQRRLNVGGRQPPMVHCLAATGEAIMSQTISAIYEDGVPSPLTPRMTA